MAELAAHLTIGAVALRLAWYFSGRITG